MASEVVREGCLAVNKPRGLSSAQVVRDCQVAFNPSSFFRPLIEAEISKRKQSESGHLKKRHLKRANQVKIGHGGTLDPLATGVLILGIGSGTKVLNQFLDCFKTYETTIVFGASTDTYDRAGRILTKRPYDHITREKVEQALEDFRGTQTQIPPLYSALKMDGKPLYEYAREGKPIPREIKGRQVEVKELELVEWYEPGKHPHRWPSEQAEAAERNLAEQVWRLKKQQETGKKLSSDEKEEDDQAIAAHETFKRIFEERQDSLIKDSPSKRQKHRKEPPMMSGALGNLPESRYSNKGRDLIPESSESSTPPPWNDEGPPACKIRMTVSSGYYVRSFCHDLGAKVNSAALMAELERVRQSDFTVGGVNCLEYKDLSKGEATWGPQVADMLARWNGEPTRECKPPSSPPTSSSANQGNEKLSAKNQLEAHTESTLRKAREEQKEKDYHRPLQAEKRRRSSSPDTGSLLPPRKIRPQESPRRRDDDEKSWNGISD